MKKSKVSWEINTPHYVGVTSNTTTKEDCFYVRPELLKHSNTLALRTSEYINIKTIYHCGNT